MEKNPTNQELVPGNLEWELGMGDLERGMGMGMGNWEHCTFLLKLEKLKGGMDGYDEWEGAVYFINA